MRPHEPDSAIGSGEPSPPPAILRARILLLVAATWTAWVAAHYYAFPFARPELTDGVRASTFPYWSEAALRALGSLGGAGLTLLAAWGVGQLVLAACSRRARPPESSAFFASVGERVVFELACGFITLSILCLALAVLHLYRRDALYGLLALGTGVAVMALRRRHATLPRRRFSISPYQADTVLLAVCMLLAVGCAFVGALAPEIEYDALWYHLWLPQRWLEAGAPVDVVNEYVSLYPLSWELLYGIAMTAGGPGAAKLLHFACLPLLAMATRLVTRHLFPHASGIAAAAFVVASPTMIWEATTAYNDLPLALFATLSVHALIRFTQTHHRRWSLLAAVMMGATLATKHLALLALAAVALPVVVNHVVTGADWRRSLRRAAIFLIVALTLPSPWYARSYVASGNPVFPEFYTVFGAQPPERWNATTDGDLQRFNDRFGRARSLKTLLLLPWDVSVHGARYAGTFGPALLILVPFGLCNRRLTRTATLVAVGAGTYLALWATPISSFQLRFLIPVVPVLAAFGSAGLARLRQAATRLAPRAASIVMVPVAIVLLLNLPAFTRLHESDRNGWNGWLSHVSRALPARVVLGAVSTDEYLRASVSSYAAWAFIDGTLPPESRILTFAGGDQLYSHHPRLWSDAAAARGLTWGASAGHERDVLDEAARMGITHVLFDRGQIRAGSLAMLAIHSEKMRTCCLTPVWQDSNYELVRLNTSP
jgi:hypothetical protein